ncbi:TIGR02594 family protein [Brucella sp. TWI432]
MATSPYDFALTKLGKNEAPDRADLMEYMKNGGVNLDPKTTAWCAAFVNASLSQAGQQGTGSNMARSFLKWGEGVQEPQRGDLAVFTRGDPNGPFGHVGFFDSMTLDGKIRVLGGNQGNAVSYANYDPSQLLGYRRSISSQVASQQASPPQASGTPAPGMGEPINIGSQSQGGIMGAFAPPPQQQQPSFMAGVDQIKNGNYLDGVGQMFGSMSAGGGQQQAPQAPAMQLAPVQGPSGQQATALANYVQALLGKKVSNG